MAEIIERHKVIITRFQDLLRSGKNYKTQAMYKEVGETMYLAAITIEKVINKYYREVVAQDKEMIDFVKNLKCNRREEVMIFSNRFKTCDRESILLIKYIRRRNE